uniref:Low molecular weight phosphotyrosine protein phosphatase n=1 Tax=Ciona savignyi TaxID=51511 RepID=H2YMJ8_CIOSA
MEKHGIYKHVAHHRARQITQRDFEDFDFIFGMDESNMRNLHQVAPKNHKSKILLLATYCPDLAHDGVIEDPYYSSSQSAFEEVYQQCVNACANFLKSI